MTTSSTTPTATPAATNRSTDAGEQKRLLERYDESLLGVFGSPARVLVRGEGCEVWDADGDVYLDLLGGIGVNALGHGHPDLVAAIGAQAAELVHISNFFTSVPQIELAERILALAEAPAGSAAFFTNSGTEAVEAAIKLARRTGRPGLLAAEDAFHGRSTGALALTAKEAYRAPFEPLLPGVRRVPFNDVAALEAAFSREASQVGALILEPVQGEGGVIPADVGYLRRARDLTRQAGALLIVDEIQSGVARTGTWFAFQQAGIVPDAMTLAKGLGGGVPIGALVTFGAETTALLTAGQHGTTFGGNPLACRAGLTVLDVIARDGLVDRARELGDELRRAVTDLRDERITEIRGRGLLIGIGLADGIASGDVAKAALEAGFIVNPARPDTIRLAPPLVVTSAQLQRFARALPGLLDAAAALGKEG
ncbi:acetylornithine transaminase [Mobilicoccus massiliensis]|uniref:acetylornithine transaminase n=1 Tax=Mobilicoccus massiliensis TaxID=1522310 RepID=UPI0009E2510C|nr:acetylornithine transaminase [Mobilicoccus massiliensis]